MLKIMLKINLWSSLLFVSFLEIAASSPQESIYRVQEMINDNFEKTQGRNNSNLNSTAVNRANFFRTVPDVKSFSEVPKPISDKKNHTRNFSSYEFHEPKKHNEREVNIIYEASKSSAKVHPQEKEVKKAPYYNTSIKYSSKYSLTPEETRNINITENAVEYDEDDDDDYEEEDEDQEDYEEKSEVTTRKPTENITRSPIIKKDREELTEKPKIFINNEKLGSEGKRLELPRPPYLPNTIKENLGSEGRRLELPRPPYLPTTIKENLRSEGKRLELPRPPYLPNTIKENLKSEGKREDSLPRPVYLPNIIKEPNLLKRNYMNYPARQKINPNIKRKYEKIEKEKEEVTEKPRPPVQKEKLSNNKPLPSDLKEKLTPKSERRNGIFPGQANYYITSSSRINKPQKPHRESDLKNEQSRYYWKDGDEENHDDEVKPLEKDPVSSLKVLPTEPVKILEDEIITSHPYEEPQPVSFSSVVYNNPNGESTSELSGSYYDNEPNVIQERVDDRESEEQEQEDDEISENSMEDTKSVPYTTPNYQSIQTPLNQIKFVDSYAYRNPFAQKLNNFAYEYEKLNQKQNLFDIYEKKPADDAPYRASLYPNKATLEKPRLKEESQESQDSPEEITEKYRARQNELRSQEKNRYQNQEISQDSPEEINEKYRARQNEIRSQQKNQFRNQQESGEYIPPPKQNYYQANLPNADDSPEYRPNIYKQTIDTTEQYSDNVKHYPKANLFNYNITRHKYPYQYISTTEQPLRININQEQSNYNPTKSKPPKPYNNQKNETGYRSYVPPPRSYINVTKEHYDDIPITSQNKHVYGNEENNKNSRRPQKFSQYTNEDEPKPQTIVKPFKNENVKDNNNEETEVREPERNNYLDYSANNIFSPESKASFDNLEENDGMYQEILANIQSLFGTRINTVNLGPVVADDKASFSKPIIPVDYQSYLQPHFEENSYENLKRNENEDDEENRSEDVEDESEDVEDEENESERYEDENEDVANYEDDDDGSETNSNVQKVRSTEKYHPKSKNIKKYNKKITKDKPKKIESFKTQIYEVQSSPRYPPITSVSINEGALTEQLNLNEPNLEVTTASYQNSLKHEQGKYNSNENKLVKPQYTGAKVIIKDAHSSPGDSKTIRVIVPKLITKDNVAIPQTHRQKLIIRNENRLFK